MKHTAILSSCYLPPVQYMSKIRHYDNVIIDIHEHYVKQTYRNRCRIDTASGVQALTVPVDKVLPGQAMKDIGISDHGNWRHLHLTALDSSYGNSPFYEYYRDDFAPFYEKRYENLVEYNTALLLKICELMELEPHITMSDHYIQGSELDDADDFRTVISPKNSIAGTDGDFTPKEYYQVFALKHGFVPNLSSVDLLFNMGRESLLIL